MPRRSEFHAFIDEDVGRGDITTELLVDRGRTARAVIFPKEPCVLAGVEEAGAVFGELGVEFAAHAADGSEASAGQVVAEVTGKARSILKGERVALNFLQRMSGIATLTRRVLLKGRELNPRLVVAATRKTTPGFRAFEKRAVALGGGDPHRYGLDDMILVKDNHHALTGGVRASMERLRAHKARPFTKKVEVEVSTLEDALRAAKLGADMVMLDNFTRAKLPQAYRSLKARHPHVLVEVSGNINEANVRSVARYADIVSCGELTHSARAVDFTLEMEPKKAKRAKRVGNRPDTKEARRR